MGNAPAISEEGIQSQSGAPSIVEEAYFLPLTRGRLSGGCLRLKVSRYFAGRHISSRGPRGWLQAQPS